MRVPNTILDQIIATHELGVPVVHRAGFEPESVDVAIAVEQYRWFWKPKDVKLVLLAESHVHTTSDDYNTQLDISQITSLIADTPFAAGPDQPSLFHNYVRLVYCLGYGEMSLIYEDTIPKLTDDESTWSSSNKGTYQYWSQLFGALAGTGSQPKAEHRIPWKIKTLTEMYRKGIWLLDASVHAIYRRHNTAIMGNDKNLLHQQWWDGYGKFILFQGNNAQIWVIGKGVYNALTNCSTEFAHLANGWVYQPNARITNETRNEVFLPLKSYADSLPDASHDGRVNVI